MEIKSLKYISFGCDWAPNEMLIFATSAYLNTCLSWLNQTIMRTRLVSNNFNTVIVCPIPKAKVVQNSASDFLFDFFISSTSRLFELLLLKHSANKLKRTHRNQLGYRAPPSNTYTSQSTTTAHLALEFYLVDNHWRRNGILSPFLINFFIDDLLHNCTELNIGCQLGNNNESILANCDDTILVSSYQDQLKRLLRCSIALDHSSTRNDRLSSLIDVAIYSNYKT